ncbi:ATP-dependent DNA helicase PIF2-like [Papaver somniferum]|uniref:ATP-dependent DNA helicase PIF2-like n=1 Tax=Papaver somniferum TaxID=3469 RepID=UPI000E700094|nr:ATP-dependent DNA helicase PIF2-like [Papaver somniferum]
MKKYEFQTITEDVGTSGTNDLVTKEKSIHIPPEDLAAIGRLNNDQRHAFDRVVKSVYRRESSIFFIDGRFRENFLYRAILAYLRTEGHIAIATATSGIVATMMSGGRTAHSRFKIPVPADSTSSCDIPVDTDLADLIRKASLIIWDEPIMENRYAFEDLDRILRAVTKVEKPFGGKVLVFGGDFRQVLPVIERGTRAQAVSACLTNAKFWKDVKVSHLKENMRSRLDPDFSEFLVRIGDKVEPYVMEDMVKLPGDIVLEWDGEQAIKRLIDEVFPRFEENAFDKVYMSQRALITPNNDVVEKINQKVIEIFSGTEVVYHSFDTITDDPKNLWAKVFLNTIAPGRLPPPQAYTGDRCTNYSLEKP